MAENFENEVEIAWAAGLFDGEGGSFSGTVRYYVGNPYCYPRISVKQVTQEPLDRFVRAVGGSMTGPDKQGAYRVQASGKRASVIMDKLWPYLTEIKRVQWNAAVTESERRCAA